MKGVNLFLLITLKVHNIKWNITRVFVIIEENLSFLAWGCCSDYCNQQCVKEAYYFLLKLSTSDFPKTQVKFKEKKTQINYRHNMTAKRNIIFKMQYEKNKELGHKIRGVESKQPPSCWLEGKADQGTSTSQNGDIHVSPLWSVRSYVIFFIFFSPSYWLF